MSLKRRLKKARAWVPGVTILVALAAFGNTLGANAASMDAESAPVQIDLGPSPMQQALEKLAGLTHLQILYDPDLLRGITTTGLHGKLTPRRALEKLLAPAGIAFQFTAEDAVALQGKARPQYAPDAVQPEVPGQVHSVIISAARDKDSGYDSAATLGRDRKSVV